MTNAASWPKIIPRTILDDISVVIPTLGRDLLQDCLLSIAMGSAWPKNLIVIDQSSSQKVESWISILNDYRIQALYIPSSKRGVAAGLNEGISRVATRFIAITHDDCLADVNWLINMHTYLMDNPDEIITGRVEPGGVGTVVSIKTSSRPEKYRRPNLKEDILYPNNMGCAKEYFSKIGYFDEREFLRYAEDNDWSYRALKLGITIAYVPEIAVTHQDWRDHDQLAITYRNYAISQGGFYGKHLRNGDWFIAIRVVIGLVRSLKRIMIGVITNNRELMSTGLVVLLNMIPGIKAGFKGSIDNG
jgi:GT2 family glycosyltransferase